MENPAFWLISKKVRIFGFIEISVKIVEISKSRLLRVNVEVKKTRNISSNCYFRKDSVAMRYRLI